FDRVACEYPPRPRWPPRGGVTRQPVRHASKPCSGAMGSDRTREASMTRSAPALSLGALAALATLYAAPALAANKVWVSNTGADGASCGDVTAPCATFQRAHTNVDAGGDIGVLTPGDYGPANITKAVNITNDDVGEAAILAPA